MNHDSTLAPEVKQSGSRRGAGSIPFPAVGVSKAASQTTYFRAPSAHSEHAFICASLNQSLEVRAQIKYPDAHTVCLDMHIGACSDRKNSQNTFRDNCQEKQFVA